MAVWIAGLVEIDDPQLVGRGVAGTVERNLGQDGPIGVLVVNELDVDDLDPAHRDSADDPQMAGTERLGRIVEEADDEASGGRRRPRPRRCR